jgi:hypothetical protein
LRKNRRYHSQLSVLDQNFLMPETTTSSPSASWDTERSSLVAETLRGIGREGLAQSRNIRMRVYGESMLPALWPGDIVEIAPCALQEVKKGEIVLATREGRFFLHRFLAPCQPDGFLLRGDSMPGGDPFFPLEALLGRLVRRTESSRGTLFSIFALGPGWSAKFSRALGFLFCHIGLVRRIVLGIHGRMASTSDFCCSKNGAEPEAL